MSDNYEDLYDDEDGEDIDFGSEGYEDEDDFSDEEGEDITDESESNSTPIGTTSVPTQSGIISQLFAVFKGDKEPKFGIGYDWDMLFAVYMRKAHVKPADATEMAWNTATVAEFKNLSGNDEGQFANTVLCNLGEDVCRVSRELFGVSGTAKPDIIAGVTKALISRYFTAYGVSASADGLTCKQAYAIANGTADKGILDYTNYKHLYDTTVADVVNYLMPVYERLIYSTDGLDGILFPSSQDERTQSGNAMGLFDISSEGIPTLLQEKTLSINMISPVIAEALHKAGISLNTWVTDYSDFRRGTARPSWHLYHARGIYFEHSLSGIKARVAKNGNKIDISALKDGLKQEVMFELAELFNDVTKQVDKNTLKQELETLGTGTSLYAAVSNIVSQYKERCFNMLFVTSTPEATGVLGLLYRFCSLNGSVLELEAASKRFSSYLHEACAKTNTSGAYYDMSAQNTLGKDLKVLSAGIDTALSNIKIYTFKAAINAEVYAATPLFAYKPIQTYLDSGKPFSASRVLVGQSLTGSDYFLNLSSDVLVQLFAASRSGKGVMTLAILANLLANGSMVTYADFKPDMATVFWNYVSHINSIRAQSGKPPVRFLSCEFMTEEGAKYTDAGLTQPPYGVRMQSSTNPTISALASAFKKETYEIEPLVGVLGIMKYLHLTFAYKRRCTPKQHMTVVLDEVNTILPKLGELVEIMRPYVKELSTAESKKLQEKEPDEYARWQLAHSITQMYVGTPSGGATTNFGESRLKKNITAYLNQKSNDGLRMTFLLIGQSYIDALDTLGLSDKAGSTVFNILFNLGSARKLFGNFATEADRISIMKQYTTDKATVARSRNLELAIDSDYLHTMTDPSVPGVSGFWLSAKGASAADAFKSYLILNENDFDYNNPCVGTTTGNYAGALVSRLGNPIASVNDPAITEAQKAAIRDLCMPNSTEPQPAVGFNGLLDLIASGSGTSIEETIGIAYEEMLKFLQTAGATDANGQLYTSLEDYIFDFRPESLIFDLFNPHSAKVNNITSSSTTDGFKGVDMQDDVYEDSGVFDEQQVPLDANSSYNDTQMPLDEEVDDFGDTDAPSPMSEEQSSTAEGQSQSSRYSQPAPAPHPAPFNPPMPIANPSQTTQSCSAYNAAYTEPISFGEGAETPFACFHSGGKYTNLRIRKMVSDFLIKEIRKVFGGYDAVTRIEEQNGVLIINDMPFTPKLDEATIVLAPYAMQADLRRGAYASMLFYKDLRVCKRLQYLAFETSSVTDLFFSDNNLNVESAKLRSSCLKRWKQLRVLLVYGENLLDVPQDNEPVRREAYARRERAVKEHRLGASFGAFLATTMGIETNSADRHPVATQLGRTKLAKAARTGALVGGMTWGMSLLLGLSNPFLIIGGAITAAAYAKSKWDEHRINRGK